VDFYSSYLIFRCYRGWLFGARWKENWNLNQVALALRIIGAAPSVSILLPTFHAHILYAVELFQILVSNWIYIGVFTSGAY